MLSELETLSERLRLEDTEVLVDAEVLILKESERLVDSESYGVMRLDMDSEVLILLEVEVDSD